MQTFIFHFSLFFVKGVAGRFLAFAHFVVVA